MMNLKKSSNFQKNIENICPEYVKVDKNTYFMKKTLAIALKR
jgi:hypothetical protein